MARKTVKGKKCILCGDTAWSHYKDGGPYCVKDYNKVKKGTGEVNVVLNNRPVYREVDIVIDRTTQKHFVMVEENGVVKMRPVDLTLG